MRHTSKGSRYRMLIGRADSALRHEFFLEASWICYAIIEDRFISLFEKLGHKLNKKQKMAFCIEQLLVKRKADAAIAKEFSEELLKKLDAWRDRRNQLCHDLAKDDLSGDAFKHLANEGRTLMARLSAACMRYKKKGALKTSGLDFENAESRLS